MPHLRSTFLENQHVIQPGETASRQTPSGVLGFWLRDAEAQGAAQAYSLSPSLFRQFKAPPVASNPKTQALKL